MSYPSSSEVLSGTPILASQMNAVRADALRMGRSAADAVTLGQALRRFSQFMTFEAEGTTKVRVPFDDRKPPTIMVNGYLLQSSGDVDSPALSGAAGSYYLMAKRTAGSTTFSLVWSATGLEGTDERYVAGVDWNGTAITEIVPFEDINSGGGMKVAANSGPATIPSAVGRGTSVTTSGTANTFGAWVEMRAASGNELLIYGLTVNGNSSTMQGVRIQLATGASSSESVVGEIAVGDLPMSGGYGAAQVIQFPIPIKVAASTRIACRASQNIALGTSVDVHLLVIETANLEDL